MKKSDRIFIFALDGVPLKLARKLASDGVMPNLAMLFKRGSWGNLESSLPPLTAPAWASFATGKDPSGHGVFNFLQPKRDLNNLEVISSEDIKGKTFYEILEEKGKKCVFVNLPCSYPPRIKKGVLISSFLAGEDFYYPKGLIKKIPELKKYKVAPDFALGLNIKKGLSDILEIEKTRFLCGKKLFKKEWDLFFYLVSGTDWAMHLAFDKLIEGKKVDLKIKKIFKKADSHLGWFLDNLPLETKVFVMSDHGFSAYSKVFYINAWLKKKKLLEFKIDWAKTGARGLTEVLIPKTKPTDFKGKLKRKIAVFFLKNPVFYTLLTRFIRTISYFFPALVPEHILNVGLAINPKKTKAYALPGSGGWFGLFLNDKKRFKNGVVLKKDYLKLRQKLYRELKKILGKGRVWLKEEIYQGRLIERGADILYAPKDIFVSSTFSRTIWADKKNNHHSRSGFFVIASQKLRPVRRSSQERKLKIIDLASMILYSLGIKPPVDMRGKTLKFH